MVLILTTVNGIHRCLRLLISHEFLVCYHFHFLLYVVVFDIREDPITWYMGSLHLILPLFIRILVGRIVSEFLIILICAWITLGFVQYGNYVGIGSFASRIPWAVLTTIFRRTLISKNLVNIRSFRHFFINGWKSFLGHRRISKSGLFIILMGQLVNSLRKIQHGKIIRVRNSHFWILSVNYIFTWLLFASLDFNL